MNKKDEFLKRDIMLSFWHNFDDLLRMLEIGNADELCFFRSEERSTARLQQARKRLFCMISNLDDILTLDDEENER